MGKTIKLLNDTYLVNDYYSYVNETRVGTWVNNKPLYRKTFCFRNISTNQETFINWGDSAYGTGVQNIEEIINYKAFYKRGNPNGTLDTFQQVPNVHQYMNAWGSSIYDLKPNGFNFWVGSLNGYFTILELVVTIEYTKTTD